MMKSARTPGFSRARLWLAGLFASICLANSVVARADMHREGEWPDGDGKQVSLKFDGSRIDAIHMLADQAGWSLVVTGAKPGQVNIHVKDQPALKVLALLLADGDYRVQRDGGMISITQLTAAGANQETIPALPPPPNVKHGHRGEDRVVTGSSLVVKRDETVGDLTVMGGSVEVYGTVAGDVAVFGGSLQVHDGGHIYGDVATLGGSVEIENGAQVDGDVSSAGGSVERAQGAFIGGDATSTNHGRDDERKGDKTSVVGQLVKELGNAIARAALLFAFGTVLLALATPRMDILQREVATRPMRAFALGIVGMVSGVFAFIVLCITIIGIPVAIVALLVGALCVYAGICATFTVLGGALLHGRSASPYVHLGLGCALYLAVSSIPVVGWLVTLVAVLVGLGLIVSTRAAGLFVRRSQTLPPALSSSV